MAYYVDSYDMSPMNVLPSRKAGVALAVGELVYMDSGGLWQKADAVALTETTRKDTLGVMIQTALANETINPVRTASIRGYSGMTIGTKVFLSDTAGESSTTEPTTNVRQIVGFAEAADIICFCIGVSGAPADVGGDENVDTLAASGIISANGGITMGEEKNILTGATTGSYIAEVDDKLAFWAATPVVQQSHVGDPAATSAATTAGTAAPTAYTAHSAGGVTVTSTAATDLDTTAAAVDTLIDEVTLYETELSAVVADIASLKTAVDANNTAIDSINALCALLGLTATS